MHLVIIQHGNTSAVATWLSWVILVGALYGSLRLVIDVGRRLGIGLMARADRAELARRRAADPAIRAAAAEMMPEGLGLLEREPWKAARRQRVAGLLADALPAHAPPPDPHE